MRKFHELKEEIVTTIEKAIKEDDFKKFKSLTITNRFPNLKRIYFQLGEERISLHEFTKAENSNCFLHPHAWESEITLIEGVYKHYHYLGLTLITDYSKALKDRSFKTILTKGSSYHIDSPLIWHKVVPLTTCNTIMINAPKWDVYSKYCTFTKGTEEVNLNYIEKVRFLQKSLKLIKKL